MPDGSQAVLGHRADDPDVRDTTDSFGHTMLGVVTSPYFDWTSDRQHAPPVQRDRHLRGARQGDDDAPPGHPADPARHLRRAGPPRDGRVPGRPRHQRDRADAHPPVRPGRVPPGSRASATTGATTRSASSRPHNEYAATGTLGEQVNEFKGMVKQLHMAGIEVILDVVYNHTAEGNHRGPDAVVPRHRQPGLLPARARRPPALLRHHRHRQLHERAQPALPADDHGLAALLGDRDARRRLPVRPGLQPRPRVPRGGQALDLLRPGPAGPGRVPGQADRRALGPRRGRLPGGQLPLAVDRVERQVPGHDARLLARRARDAAGVRLPVHRVLGPVPEQRPQPARLDQLRHRPRRLHAGGPGVLRRQAQRRQRRGRPRRGVAQPVVELRRGGPHPRPVHPRPARAAAAQHHGHPAAEPGGPDDRPRRRDRAHPAGQQQHLLPGQRAVLDGLGRRRRGHAVLHPVRDRPAPAGTRSSGAGASSRASGSPSGTRSPTSPGCSPTPSR